MACFKLLYKSEVESNDMMLTDVEKILQENEIDGRLKNILLLAVSEAFTNALIHGNQSQPEKIIKLILTINENELSADIIDEGKGGLDKIRNKKPSQLLDHSGRGVDLIKHYATNADFQEINGGGLKVSLIFSRNKKKTTI